MSHVNDLQAEHLSVLQVRHRRLDERVVVVSRRLLT